MGRVGALRDVPKSARVQFLNRVHNFVRICPNYKQGIATGSPRSVSDCHCPGDRAVRMREVLARSWVFVCGVPLALSLSSSNKGNPGFRKTYLGPFL